jgi:hypothetical protein
MALWRWPTPADNLGLGRGGHEGATILSIRGLLVLLSASCAVLLILKATGVVQIGWWLVVAPLAVIIALFAYHVRRQQ